MSQAFIYDMRLRWDNFTAGWEDHVSAGIWDLMDNLYKVPARYYHSLTWHIYHALCELDRVRAECPDYTNRWDEVEYSIWMHDIYNQPGSVNNEYNSKNLAAHLCVVHTPLDFYRVSWNILATTHCLNKFSGSQTPEYYKPEECLTCDLDLSGFIADEHTFLESQRRLRLEYSDVAKDVYLNARNDFLQRLLDRGYVFLTPMYQPHEDFAHTRIEAIIRGDYNGIIT